jgi:hypothetical protein
VATFDWKASRLFTRERVDYPGMAVGFGCIGISWVVCCCWLQCRLDFELCNRAENGNIDIVVFGLAMNILKFRGCLYVLVEDGDADVFRNFFICIDQ